MAGKVKPIPDGFHTITPYLTVPGVAKLIDFVKQAFDAKEIERMQRPDGTVQHAEVKIGDSIVMMGESGEQTGAMIHVYVPDVDACFERAIAAGGTSMRKPETMFYGDRVCRLVDPDGYAWSFGTNVADFDPSKAPWAKK